MRDWLRQATQPGVAEEVLGRIASWLKKVGIPQLAGLVETLLAFLRCPEIAVPYKALIIAALLYLMSPLDLVPDFLLGVGFVDDVAVLTAVIAFLQHQLDKAQTRCARQGRSCDSCPLRVKTASPESAQLALH